MAHELLTKSNIKLKVGQKVTCKDGFTWLYCGASRRSDEDPIYHHFIRPDTVVVWRPYSPWTYRACKLPTLAKRFPGIEVYFAKN